MDIVYLHKLTAWELVSSWSTQIGKQTPKLVSTLELERLTETLHDTGFAFFA